MERAVPRGRRLRPHLLPLAPAPDQAQERQHRRLLPALGQPLPLHGRARRRQRDERRRASTTLVRLAEANPDAGIIQTAPRAAGRDTLYARMQQFATRVYGPLFTAGLHYWQLGESHYWGHNAIIRVAPFMRHCALERLPGNGRAVRRDPVARLRRGRADAPRGLGRVDRLRPAGQLRGDAAQPARRAAARPPLVPGQPDELPAVPRRRACIPRTASCS